MDSCVQLAEQLEIGVHNVDINEILLCKDEELTNDDLTQLEVFRNSEENNKLIESINQSVKKFATTKLRHLI